MVEKESTRVTSAKPSSSPPLPPTRNPTKVKSFTREEIDRYWRMQRMIEEDHLLFAQKAAARIRAKSLKASISMIPQLQIRSNESIDLCDLGIALSRRKITDDLRNFLRRFWRRMETRRRLPSAAAEETRNRGLGSRIAVVFLFCGSYGFGQIWGKGYSLGF
ncbi:hypothetical protein ZIOFF_024125 [Zingiber officinale]|uniref:Uncharacterized protein n=1 Tax=Zingiber officinale TaxID=94328 RepID=A0A8J5GT37_ZINOF|nr:hypothetical protein ZIOFF_024125 [Zingiber officinale]